ncbi:unnamed protein product [Enterobius vermicularis]|uniref:Metaxin n=1 Tax=Enterobius vermicularis TaxID=51028 RepID=A0A0N4UXT5_ENTVE|nr:unnamed protein product [Enterobius vermicularis]
MMELYIWPSEFGLPSVDPQCLQFMACAKFCAAPITVVPSTSPWKFNGSFPLVAIKREGRSKPDYVADFDSFAEILRTSAQDVILDSELTAAQRSEFDAYSSMMLQSFYPALLYLLWLDRWNYEAVTSPWFSTTLFFPYGLYYLEKHRMKVKAYIDARGRSEKSLLLDAMTTISLLSAKLGDNKYFYGDKPSSLDALIFGYLAPIMKMPLPSDRLQQHLLSFANLVRFVESIISIYLPLTDSQLRLQSVSRDVWFKRRTRAQKAAERLNIKKQTAEPEEAVSQMNFAFSLSRTILSLFFIKFFTPLRDTVLFAFAAVTLSLLFAVHTGLVAFQTSDEETEE